MCLSGMSVRSYKGKSKFLSKMATALYMEDVCGHFVKSSLEGVRFQEDCQKEKSREFRDYRHWLLRCVQRMLYFENVESSMGGCLQGTFVRWDKKEKQLVNRAEIHMHNTGASLVGVAHCKNPLCPVCGPIIASRRLNEIEEASKRLLVAGYTYLFVTFTAWHPADISLGDFIEMFKKAWKKFYSSAGYKWLKRNKNFPHMFSINSTEVTDDDPFTKAAARTGWHLHRHSVEWFDTHGHWLSDKEIAVVKEKLLSAWKKALEFVGLTCSDERGVFIQSIQYHAERTGLKTDFNKLSDEAREKYVLQVTRYVSKSLGFELTGTGRKKAKIGAKGNRRINHWRLLEQAVMGDKRARERWIELFQAFAAGGISTCRMSQGLRDFAGLKEEKTDQDLMSDGELAQRLVAFGSGFDFEADDWKIFAKQGRLSHLLSLVEDDYFANKDVVSTVQIAMDCARAGLDILTDQFLPEGSDFARDWNGKSFAMASNLQPALEQAARIAIEKAERQEAYNISKQCFVDDVLDQIESLNRSAQYVLDDVRLNPELYSAGRIYPIAEKRAAWDRVGVGLWDEMCSILEQKGYVVPVPFWQPSALQFVQASFFH